MPAPKRTVDKTAIEYLIYARDALEQYNLHVAPTPKDRRDSARYSMGRGVLANIKQLLKEERDGWID